MAVALRLYEQLTAAQDDQTRARLIAEAFEEMENRYPQIKDMATQEQARVTELRLVREIELIRQEVKALEAKLSLEMKEIESRLSLEMRDIESRLSLEIRALDNKRALEARGLEVKIAESRAELVRWVVGAGLLQSTLIIAVLMNVAHLI
jgi:hypothetical protein